MKAEELEPQLLAQVWRGELDDEFGQAAVIGTAAIALKLLGKADDQAQAEALAARFWAGRDRNRF